MRRNSIGPKPIYVSVYAMPSHSMTGVPGQGIYNLLIRVPLLRREWDQARPMAMERQRTGVPECVVAFESGYWFIERNRTHAVERFREGLDLCRRRRSIWCCWHGCACGSQLKMTS